MLIYYYNFFLYVCVDICYDFQKIPYRKTTESDVLQEFAEGNVFGNISSGVCNFCDKNWNESPLGNASDYTKFLFYSRETGTNYTEVVSGNITSLEEAGFNITKGTKILVHGWRDSALIHFGAQLREDVDHSKLHFGTTLTNCSNIQTYLEAYDANIIIVDWSQMAYLFYPLSRVAVDPVGRYVAVLVDWLVTDVGVPPPSLHLVGHSLGAQIAGVAGEHVTSGPLSRISGLDPAGPGFDWQKNGRLDASDARFVDIIHTSGGWAGYYSPCGHVDFYPNGGIYNQPGCPLDWGKCSHLRSYKFFAESVVSNGFAARACDGWWDYKQALCANNSEAFMGEYVDPRASGTYYLRTAGQYPYALG